MKEVIHNPYRLGSLVTIKATDIIATVIDFEMTNYEILVSWEDVDSWGESITYTDWFNPDDLIY